MPLLINGPILHAAVERDGLPRLVTADDGSLHVLYLENELVRSLTSIEWLAQRGALPVDPTPQQIAAGIAARDQARTDAQRDAAQLRQALRAKLASAVGVSVDDLLVGQMRALLAYLLWREGALTPDLKVKPLSEWEGRR